METRASYVLVGAFVLLMLAAAGLFVVWLGRYQAEWNSVNVPKTGTQIRIVSETQGGFTQIQVRPSK